MPTECRGVIPPNAEMCDKPATHKVTFSPGDSVGMCLDCALRLQQMANAHRSSVKVEKIA